MPTITLTSPKDRFVFDAYRAPPTEARRGGLVILHAIWGVTPHFRDLADGFAAEGYEVLIPSLFDRTERGFPERDRNPALLSVQMAKGEATGWGQACIPDIQAAIDALAGPVFVMGFCFGGTAAWLAACRCERVTGAAAFYGGQIVLFKDEVPSCPTILHFGRKDELIPLADVEAIRAAHPDLPIHEYDAGHAFVAPSEFHADSARLAMLRTRALFHRASGAREAGA